MPRKKSELEIFKKGLLKDLKKLAKAVLKINVILNTIILDLEEKKENDRVFYEYVIPKKIVRYSNDKDINKLCKKLVSEKICRPVRKNRHYQLVFDDLKTSQTVPGTPSDFRARKKFEADTKRILKRLEIAPALFGL